MKVAAAFIAAGLGVLVLMFGFTELDLNWKRFFLPQYEDVRRDVNTHSRAYVEGTARHLYELKLQYAGANDEERQAIRQLVLTEAGGIDRSTLPVDLRSFIASLGG